MGTQFDGSSVGSSELVTSVELPSGPDVGSVLATGPGPVGVDVTGPGVVAPGPVLVGVVGDPVAPGVVGWTDVGDGVGDGAVAPVGPGVLGTGCVATGPVELPAGGSLGFASLLAQAPPPKATSKLK